ncbi:M20/M25/M40 family metallo-hydrolase [Nocardia sp. NPDC059180]|uniref:M20/M25/M40 family metallo-hydrolase n=1 Tax=Nocardia sp. NPDC059180 TaxID=3346761 RepID=UPI0036BEEFCF
MPGTVELLRKVNGDSHIALDTLNASEPTPVSPTDGPAFDRIRKAVAHTFPDAFTSRSSSSAAATPATSTRSASSCTAPSPFELDARTRGLIHSTDERLSVDALEQGIRFYTAVLRGDR